MGFDNDCIIKIGSLAGEYFCPVCRMLVHPREAIQSTVCTHLFCKPCFTSLFSSTKISKCPYDGYPVNQANSKPLSESNMALSNKIGKIEVRCLYYRSGCKWEGHYLQCMTHISGCDYRKYPVVCIPCGMNLDHCEVQEHAQTCNLNDTNA